DGIQVLTAREREGTTDGLFLAAKGGHNAESHNHNDVGHFIVGLDGAPVLIDVGVETYTRKTFSAERYEIWTMQSAYHNLPTIDGQQQLAGAEFRANDVAAEVSNDAAGLSLDIASAYPSEAGIRSWRRSIRLDRGPEAAVTLRDTWDLAWAPAQLTLALMAASDVEVVEPGVLRCMGVGRSLDVRFDPATFDAEIERIDIDDTRLSPVWGDHVSRVLLHVTAPAALGNWILTMAAGGN
nr:heparinase II/III family protein [Chloroflexia bacterium]